MTAIAVTMIAPPPMPCSARDATSIVIEPLRPHSTDPARKNTTDDLEDGFAAEQVTELADDRGGDRRCQQIARDHPGLVARAAEVGDDGRQRGGHDGLVERGKQHAEQHRNEDEVATMEADACAARLGVARQRSSMPDSSYLPSVEHDRYLQPYR